MTMQQVKNINKTDKQIHSHKRRYLDVISRFTRFKEFNGEKKTSNMFKIVPRIGTAYRYTNVQIWSLLLKIEIPKL